MQYRKNRFSQTLPEQRPRWTSSKNISFRSFRFLFIFLEFFFCILRSQWPKLTSKSGNFRKLPFKKWKCCTKDQPRISKDLISSAYCRWKIWKGVEPEFLTNFLNLCFATEVTNSEFGRNSRLKKALWYMASLSETTLWGRAIISTILLTKKNWGKLNGEFWQYFQNRSLEQYERPFDLWCHKENQHTAAFNLTFIRRNTRFFTFVCFADIFEGRRD